MITVKQARQLIEANSSALESTSLPIDAANQYVLALDTFAAVDSPSFTNSAVDGYAFAYTDLNSQQIVCTKEVAAGQFFTGEFNAKAELIRIFTGAALPTACDSVVMQEDVVVRDGYYFFNKQALKKGAHVRQRAEQLKMGEIALEKGVELRPESLSYLASLGVEAVPVIRKPRVACLISGNELKPLGSILKDGEIYESNGVLLAAYLNQMKLINRYRWVEDTFAALKQKISDDLDEHDVVLISGGVSVGDYDFTRAAIEALGFNVIFHGISQKPGKPFLFAKKGEKYICGLPGNPRSVEVCFLMYVLPLLKRLSGVNNFPFLALQLPLATEYQRKDDGKTHFLQANLIHGAVHILPKQQSHMMSASAVGNVLIELEPNQTTLSKLDLVKTIVLPYV